jgi:hypothetical protein
MSILVNDQIDNIFIDYEITGLPGSFLLSYNDIHYQKAIKWFPDNIEPSRRGPCILITVEDTPIVKKDWFKNTNKKINRNNLVSFVRKNLSIIKTFGNKIMLEDKAFKLIENMAAFKAT